MKGQILNGRIILDRESRDRLYGEIRDEVVKDIEKDGFCYEEVLRYLKTMNAIQFDQFFKEFMDDIEENSKDLEPIFSFEEKSMNRFKMMRLMYEV